MQVAVSPTVSNVIVSLNPVVACTVGLFVTDVMASNLTTVPTSFASSRTISQDAVPFNVTLLEVTSKVASSAVTATASASKNKGKTFVFAIIKKIVKVREKGRSPSLVTSG
jgi:hypothetical protein